MLERSEMKIQRETYPSCKLPDDLDQPVFRYMDMYKFEYLIQNQSLYLCRADKLQDKFEGTYSREQITDMNDYLAKSGCPDVVKSEEAYRAKTRKDTYISCWCVGSADFDLMWKAYSSKDFAIAIKTTIKKLINICDSNIEHWPLDISLVTYYDQANGAFIGYDRLEPYLHKDNHFELDSEIRIINHHSFIPPQPDHIDISINPVELIDEIILKPGSSPQQLNDLIKILKKNGLNNIPVSFSRDDRSVAK